MEPSIDEINIEDLINEEDNIITLTHYGYIKRINVNAYKSQKRWKRCYSTKYEGRRFCRDNICSIYPS